jgi:hypothetical protein
MVVVARWCTQDDPCAACAAGREFDGCWSRAYWVEHPYDRPGPPFRYAPLKIPDRAELAALLSSEDQLLD